MWVTLAVDANFSLVFTIQSIENIHQRRFARAVLAEETMNLALFQIEIDMVVSQDTWESFGDAGGLQGAMAWLDALGLSCGDANVIRSPYVLTFAKWVLCRWAQHPW